MDCQRSGIQPSKKIKIEDDVKQEDLEAAFWKEAPEDILLEIFIRLPDKRSAIRTATVCHKWHSLISMNPLFIPRFTIFLRKADFDDNCSPQDFQPIFKIFSEEDTGPDFLDFIIPSSSSSSQMVIRGSCNDLLLVSPGPRVSTQFYICNPFTKESIQLPEIPGPDVFEFRRVVGHALVCMPPGPTNKLRFKVVEFRDTRYGNDYNMVQTVMLFCSESRKWEKRSFHYPKPLWGGRVSWLHGVACKGILYWLEFEHFRSSRVIYLDLSNDQCGAIDFPDDYCPDPCFPRNQIGVVCGEELRLLQVVLTKPMERTVDLKVWRLSHEKEWVLVHHKNKLKKPKRKSFQAVPFVHPTNGDVVFMVWGQKVFQYDLKDTKTKTYEFIGKLQQSLPEERVGWEAPKGKLLQFPVVQTHFWPTQIST